MGMSGEVWRFRVEESRCRRKSLAGGAVLGLQWELVDADGLQDAAEDEGDAAGRPEDVGDNDNDDPMSSNSGDAEKAEDGNKASSDESDLKRNGSGAFDFGKNYSSNDDKHSIDNSSNQDLENEGDDDGVDDVLNPAALFNLPPAAQSAQHGAWQALAAAAAQGAGGGVQGDAQAAHAALQAAIWAQHLGMNLNLGGNVVALDANGNPTRPSPRCAASWTCMPGSNKIYLFGGLGQENDFLSDLWCFDAGARSQCRWERLTALREDEGAEQEEDGAAAAAVPDGRWGHTMVEHKGLLYMFGGSSPGQAYTGLWRLDPSTRPCRWSLLAKDGEQPPARGGHSATVVGDTLYIFGGNITQVCDSSL